MGSLSMCKILGSIVDISTEMRDDKHMKKKATTSLSQKVSIFRYVQELERKRLNVLKAQYQIEDIVDGLGSTAVTTS